MPPALSAYRRPLVNSMHGNGGKEGPVNWEERCAKLQEENRQLKLQRNEQEQTIKDMNTKFRKLMRDYKAMTGVAPQVDTTSTATTPRSARGSSSLVSKLAEVEAQRDAVKRQLADAQRKLQMRSNSVPMQLSQKEEPLQFRQESIESYLARHEREAIRTGGASVPRNRPKSASDRFPTPEKQQHISPDRRASSPSRDPRLDAENNHLRAKAARDEETIRQLELQLTEARSGSSHLNQLYSSQRVVAHQQASDQSREMQNLRDKIAADANHIEHLKRERDDLDMKLRLRPTSQDYEGFRSSDADPDTMLRLQRDASDRSSQIAVLTSRFTHSQEQVALLRKECERLVEEIRTMHNESANVKKQMFDIEQEKNRLLLQADRVRDLEVQYQLKCDEVLNCEQHLTTLNDRLLTFQRDTEHQVRRQCNERFAELEAMRDEADRARRNKEREAFTLQQDLNDAKHEVERLKEEVAMYKSDVEKLRKDNNEMQEKSALLGAVPSDLTDDVHKVMTVMSMKKRHSDELDVAELWQGVEWSDGWEANRMREAVSTAAFDLQLADQRHQQLTQEVKEKAELLTGITTERDQLLEENIELRRRITGIQTTLSKRMLQAAKDAQDTQVRSASLSITLTGLSLSRSICQTEDGSTFTPTLFFSLDGLEGYEMALGDHFYTTNGDLSTVFVFGDLQVTASTMQRISETTFTLQLHQSYGTEGDVVAAGTIQGSTLLSNFDGSGVVSLNTTLIGSDGSDVGTARGVGTLSDEFLPFLMADKFNPLSDKLTPAMVQAAATSLRAVSALRIQIYRATSLKSDVAMPQPYVFYTVVGLPDGHLSSFVSDTVVHPIGTKVTADPTFDESTAVTHPVIMDYKVVQFLHLASVSFIVFDAFSKNVESNLGVATVPLRRLLESPNEVVMATEKLHPQGELQIGFSWIQE